MPAETGLRLRKAHSEPWGECGIQMPNEGRGGGGGGAGKLSTYPPSSPVNSLLDKLRERLDEDWIFKGKNEQ